MEEKWFDLIIATSLPLAFVVQHLWSEASFARRGVALGGQPPIDRRLFTASKYLAIGIWLAVSLQSWGIGWQPFTGVRVPRGLSGGLWVFGFGLLFLGRINLGGHLRIGLPNEATRFHRNGAYRFTRNPMYTGIDVNDDRRDPLHRQSRDPCRGGVRHRGSPPDHPRRGALAARNLRGGIRAVIGERVGRYVTVPLAVRSRTRALWTLLGMGHCAPTIMSSILRVCGRRKADWLVRLASALPGGIGNTGGECGGITSPLILLGLLHGLGSIEGGLPLVFERGHAHMEGFRRHRGTLLCREIRRTPRQHPALHPDHRGYGGALCRHPLRREPSSHSVRSARGVLPAVRRVRPLRLPLRADGAAET